MKNRRWIFVIAACLYATPVAAQGVGVKAGVSGSPDQFYFGGQYETQPIVDKVTFRPNVEVGAGDNETLFALNFEFAYNVPLQRNPWRVFFGAGPAMVMRSANGDGHTGGGFNVLVGLAHREGLFTELKIGALDSPEIKFGVGYSFGRR